MSGLFWKVRALKEQGRKRNALANALRESVAPEDQGFDPNVVPEAAEYDPGAAFQEEAGIGATGGPNMRNALNRLYSGPGDQPLMAMELEQQLQRQGQASADPKKVQFLKYMENLYQTSPEAYKRSLQALRSQQFLNQGTGFGTTDPLNPGTIVPARGGKIDIIGKKIEEATGEHEGKKIAGKGKAITLGLASEQKTGFLVNEIDNAIKNVSPLTAGPGAMTNWAPGTPAKDFAESLNTIKANLGFERLQEMRASSPTGGALGQVSEMENKLLQSVWGSLDQAQSPSQLKENLAKAKEAVIGSWQRIARAYEMDYGEPMPTEGTPLEGMSLKSGAQQQVEKKLGGVNTSPENRQNTKRIGDKTYININGQWFEQ